MYPHSTLSFSVLLTGIVGEAVSNRVLSQKYTVEETDVQVRPESLPSAPTVGLQGQVSEVKKVLLKRCLGSPNIIRSVVFLLIEGFPGLTKHYKIQVC